MAVRPRAKSESYFQNPAKIPKCEQVRRLAQLRVMWKDLREKHFFKVFWTRALLLGPTKFDLQNEGERRKAVEVFLNALDGLARRIGKSRRMNMRYSGTRGWEIENNHLFSVASNGLSRFATGRRTTGNNDPH